MHSIVVRTCSIVASIPSIRASLPSISQHRRCSHTQLQAAFAQLSRLDSAHDCLDSRASLELFSTLRSSLPTSTISFSALVPATDIQVKLTLSASASIPTQSVMHFSNTPTAELDGVDAQALDQEVVLVAAERLGHDVHQHVLCGHVLK